MNQTTPEKGMTPLPWQCGDDNGRYKDTVFGGGLALADFDFDPDLNAILANARYAVRACNSFPALLAAAEAALQLLQHNATDSYCEVCERHAPKDDAGRVVGPVPHAFGCQVPKLRDAIAAAKGASTATKEGAA